MDDGVKIQGDPDRLAWFNEILGRLEEAESALGELDFTQLRVKDMTRLSGYIAKAKAIARSYVA